MGVNPAKVFCFGVVDFFVGSVWPSILGVVMIWYCWWGGAILHPGLSNGGQSMQTILAQAEMAGLFDWSSFAQLGSVGVVSGLLIWIITKTIPGLRQEEREALTAIVTRFDQQLREQRDDLKEARLQSRTLAEAGHAAVNNLASAFTSLKVEMVHAREITKPQIKAKPPGVL